jgi:hypothetical protein
VVEKPSYAPGDRVVVRGKGFHGGQHPGVYQIYRMPCAEAPKHREKLLPEWRLGGEMPADAAGRLPFAFLVRPGDNGCYRLVLDLLANGEYDAIHEVPGPKAPGGRCVDPTASFGVIGSGPIFRDGTWLGASSEATGWVGISCGFQNKDYDLHHPVKPSETTLPRLASGDKRSYSLSPWPCTSGYCQGSLGGTVERQTDAAGDRYVVTIAASASPSVPPPAVQGGATCLKDVDNKAEAYVRPKLEIEVPIAIGAGQRITMKATGKLDRNGPAPCTTATALVARVADTPVACIEDSSKQAAAVTLSCTKADDVAAPITTKLVVLLSVNPFATALRKFDGGKETACSSSNSSNVRVELSLAPKPP